MPQGAGLPILGAVRGGRRQSGQVLVILAAMTIVLFGGLGLAVDGGILYFYNVGAGRAAEAAAAAGVVFMPNQFLPAQAYPALSGNDATDRAKVEAGKNGFQDLVNGVTVTAATVAGQPNELSVTVTATVPSFFMHVLGFGTGSVQRTAVAIYQPPVSLGQPGNQIGSSLKQLATNAYFIRQNGHARDLEGGDPFSVKQGPNEYAESASPGIAAAATNLHKISATAGTDTIDAALPAYGGQNYFINLPTGGYIQVYNAAYSPDGNGGKANNFCDNLHSGWPAADCNSAGSEYYYHQQDWITFATGNTYSAEEYTVFQVNSPYFIRSDDIKKSQMIVYPIDASNWAASPPTYTEFFPSATTITQTYAGANASNMSVYNNWTDVASYVPQVSEKGLIAYTAGYGPLAPKLAAGTYRLRVDTLDYNGAVGGAGSTAKGSHGYAVRVVDTAGGTTCAGCTLNAWDDMTIYTPVTSATVSVPIFAAPQSYAGLTADIWLYDPGDVASAGTVTLSLLDPSTAPAYQVATVIAPNVVGISDTGVNMTGAATAVPASLRPAGNQTASFISTNLPALGSDPPMNPPGTGQHFNGHWVDIRYPIPATYNPGANPWWKLQYTTSGATAHDTITLVVVLQGTPVHLVTG